MQKKHLFLIFTSLALLLSGLNPAAPDGLSAFFFLPLLLLYLDPSLKKNRFYFLLLLTGLVYYGAALSGLCLFSPVTYGISLLCAGPVFALFFLLTDLVTHKVRERPLKILALPPAGALLYKLFSFSPAGAIVLDVPFSVPSRILKLIPWIGMEGIVFLLLAAQVLWAWLIYKNKKTGAAVFLAVFFAWFFVSPAPSVKPAQADRSGKTYALIQHNLPVDGLWNFDHPEEIRKKYGELARRAALKKPALLIFPFYDHPSDLYREPEFFTQLSREIGIPILVSEHVPNFKGRGILDGGFFSGAFLYAPAGLQSTYQAVAKPPFRGIPEFTAAQYQTLETPLGRAGILLCYEDTHPDIAQKAVRMGAEFLIALSNPGQFNDTQIPSQHFNEDRLRALESGREVLRISANGYSAHIGKEGNIIQKSQLGKETILFGTLQTNSAQTFYHRYPGLTLWLCLLLLLPFVLTPVRK